jgi:hypothetical protein
LLVTVTSTNGINRPSPPPPSRSGMKLVCNVNIVYVNLLCEKNAQYYGQKPQLYIHEFSFCSIFHVVFAVPNGYHQGGLGSGNIHAETRWRLRLHAATRWRPRLYAATRWRPRLHAATRWQRVILHAAKWWLIFFYAATRWLPFFPVQAGFDRPGHWRPFSCQIQVIDSNGFILWCEVQTLFQI